MRSLFVVFICFTTHVFAGNDAFIKSRELFPDAGTSPHDKQQSLLNATKRALRQAELTGDERAIASCKYQLGKLFYTNGAFSQSIRYHHEALRLFVRLGMDTMAAQVHSSLGTTYYFARQPELAMYHQGLAFKLFKKHNDIPGMARTLTRMGHLREKEGYPDRALTLHLEALKYCRKSENPALYSEIYENIGSVYEDKESYGEALKYFNEAYGLNSRLHAEESATVNLNNIGDCYRKMGDFRQAAMYTNQALKKARATNNRYEERSALRDLYKIGVGEKNYQNAHAYLDSAYAISEAIYSDESAQQIALLGTFYELEQKDREIELLDKNKRNAQLTAWVYLLAGLLIFLILFVIVWRQRIRIKTDRRNLRTQEMVLETQQKLMQVELDNAHLRESKLSSDLQNQFLLERELQQELQLRSQALSSHTLQLIEKNGLLESLQHSLLKALKAEGAEKNRLLREVARQIDFSFHRDRDWSNFEDFFSQVHTSFYDKLKAHLPDITRTEQRLCALIKLKLESKEIAIILGITVDSLRIARYRLKKRFKLEEADSLGSFIELL